MSLAQRSQPDALSTRCSPDAETSPMGGPPWRISSMPAGYDRSTKTRMLLFLMSQHAFSVKQEIRSAADIATVRIVQLHPFAATIAFDRHLKHWSLHHRRNTGMGR